MLRINNVKVGLDDKNYNKILSNILNIPQKKITNITLIKKSIDARRNNVHFICSFAFDIENEQEILNRNKQLMIYKPFNYKPLPSINRKILVVGSGPAGLFCAYTLALSNTYVDLIERGKPINQRINDINDLMNNRILNEESNILFGEGGAGTFSDGKLTTNTKNINIPFVLNTFVKYGAPKDILYLSKAHIGTDYLRKVIVNMRKDMQDMGVNIEFETKFVDFKKINNKYLVSIKQNNEIIIREYDDIVLAIGHSARDTIVNLYNNELINMAPKPFSIGVRIEQSQAKINEIQYHKYANHPALKAANYKLAVSTKDKRGVYTFCMCPGGYIVPSVSEKEHLCINGMSEYKRDGTNANSAILVSVTPSDFPSKDPLSGIELQRDIEKKAYIIAGGNYNAPIMLARDYIEDSITTHLNDLKSTYLPGTTICDLNKIFPDFINKNLKEGLILMNKKMPGFIDENTILVGVETRSSSPVKIIRNEDYHIENESIYPIGEGAGMSGGIISSAIEGVICAHKILTIK